jgi:hypothetical protein
MKYALTLLYLLTFFVVTAQEVTELPMKNSYVYYAFEHNLENTKRCLSYYHNQGTFITNVVEKTFSLASKLKSDYSTFEVQLEDDVLIGCSDTLNLRLFSFSLPEKLPQTIFGNYKSGFLTATVNIIFTDKNSYKLTFKAFSCTFLESGEGFKSVDLETFYNTFNSKTKKSKYEIEIFSLIDNAVKGVDNLILESFKKAYETDEL